ncbi:MAG: F0F1 ATP synthase subunit B [Candidatus Omnitrophica bacterium]|nr:F0F1 ATP synthase subunit B [Candidatus Omnitrophota bacterium]
MDPLVLREIVVHALGFILFYLVLKRYAFKPIGRILEERRSRIEGDLGSAREKLGEAEALKTRYEKELEGIEAEARRKIQEAFSEGRRLAAEVHEEARSQARQIIEKARQNVELELEKARIRLKNEVVTLAADMAERALRTKLTAEDHERFAVDFIEDARGEE